MLIVAGVFVVLAVCSALVYDWGYSRGVQAGAIGFMKEHKKIQDEQQLIDCIRETTNNDPAAVSAAQRILRARMEV